MFFRRSREILVFSSAAATYCGWRHISLFVTLATLPHTERCMTLKANERLRARRLS
jgi:hypothetical protein